MLLTSTTAFLSAGLGEARQRELGCSAVWHTKIEGVSRGFVMQSVEFLALQICRSNLLS